MTTFKTFTRTVAALIGLLLILSGSASAQTATTSTTLSAAVADATVTSLIVASATNVDAGGMLYIDREAFDVVSVSSTTVRVKRGAAGTFAAPHVSGAQVWVAAKLQKTGVFIPSSKYGGCTSTAESFLPQIHAASGSILDCPSTVKQWVNLRNQVIVTCRALLVADMIDQSCFTADRPYLIAKITYVHTTPESAGTLTVIPRRQQSTEAPASGDALATAINAVAAGTAAQTVVTATLTATTAFLKLETGDRLGLDFTDDTAGELAGVVVTFYLIAL